VIGSGGGGVRVHFNLTLTGDDGMPLGLAEIQETARLIESSGFSGIWTGHHIPIPGDSRPFAATDPLMSLLLAATATSTVEIGTCTYSFGLVNASNFAQSAYTLEAFAPHRVTLGIGTGSQKQEWAVSGLDWDSRFKRMDVGFALVKDIFSGSSDIEIEEFRFGDDDKRYEGGSAAQAPSAAEPTLAMRIGSPHFMLGTWRSPAQLKRAATVYDGWMGSAGPGALYGGWRKVFTESMKTFRDAGGRRAMVATMLTDPTAPTSRLSEDGTFDLIGAPETITERLHILDEIGFDDVILSSWDNANRKYRVLTREFAEEMRSLYPVDTSVAWSD
jgi:alkanesulfonate monooxygenase SsuD/methylene tetrahydromethanopterin reductase-like flavin-dependent oxidoreductase (luciferase family)